MILCFAAAALALAGEDAVQAAKDKACE